MNQVAVVNQPAWSPEQIALVKRTICKDATDDELKLFMHVCERTGLDPFARQIYATKRQNYKTGESQMVVQTSIDGFRLAASRSNAYAGSDDPVLDDEKKPNKATVTVYKMVQGQRCAFTASARWGEYYPGPKLGFMWDKMPCVMLGKVAEALALRKAFPADLSGVYAKEEMDQAENEGQRVAPNQPGPNDGVRLPTRSAYQFPDGKFNRKYIDEISIPELESWCDWWDEQKANGKPLRPGLAEQIEISREHIKAHKEFHQEEQG